MIAEKRKVPLQYRGGGIPEHSARIAYRGYEIQFPGSARMQSFERLHERGGFGLEELVYLAFVAGRGSSVEMGRELEPREAATAKWGGKEKTE